MGGERASKVRQPCSQRRRGKRWRNSNSYCGSVSNCKSSRNPAEAWVPYRCSGPTRISISPKTRLDSTVRQFLCWNYTAIHCEQLCEQLSATHGNRRRVITYILDCFGCLGGNQDN